MQMVQVRMYTRRDRVRNEDIWDKVGVAFLVDKMMEMRLR